MDGKPTKTEKILLLCAAAFVLILTARCLGEQRHSGVTVETQYAAAASAIAPVEEGKVNINTATTEELQSLPGIGPALAQRIVDHRTEYGAFRTIEEIQLVKGIGEGKFADLAECITVKDNESET